ncbi:heavy-metal-associated domain-containing protein [Flavobacterium sp. RHBU_3]|uniref:heavy-metal-associated domain-containing protein n=1 Tax=Flavobacterium sp. RHBU_3 TaxID=3391184 RepID=UPI003984A06F
MNFAKKLSIAAVAALVFASCKDTAKTEATAANDEAAATETKAVAANMETTTFKIDGMTCPEGCAKTIESKLGGMEGVENAKVDFDSKTATISFDPAKQTPEKFVETVEKIADGAYKVSDVKSSGDKAYYDASAYDKGKKKKAAAKTTAAKKDAKAAPSCCAAHADDKAAADAKPATGEKKAGCCSAGADKKASCHSEKGGNL